MAPLGYNKLKHNLSPEEISSHAEQAIAKFKATFDSIANLKKGEHSFENVVKAAGQAEFEFVLSQSICEFPKDVSPITEVRDASMAASQKFREADVEAYSREDVYLSLLAYESKGDVLEGEDKRYFQKIKLEFERNGLKLLPEKRKHVTDLKKKISQLCLEFEVDCNADKSEMECTKEELQGMDEDYLSRLAQTPEGKYRVTMKYPDATPLLNNCSVVETRRRCETLFSNRGGEANVDRLQQIISLRHQVAVELGYPTHAAYTLEPQMAKSPEVVKEFEEGLVTHLRPAGLKERQRLLEMKSQAEGKPLSDTLAAWDWIYYDNLLLKKEYGVDENEIMKYFPLKSTVEGTFQVYQKLFSLRFEEVLKFEKWHEEVQLFEVFDGPSGNFLGAFYLDLYPRDNKYSHAAVFPLQPGCLDAVGARVYPVVSMVCNFTRPSASSPSLLRHGEFETFFHEFGHVVHGICGGTKYARFSGTGTESDFVECPSQALENWCWEKEILQSISQHYETKQPLPTSLIENLVRSRDVNVSLKTLRQVFFGLVDQTFHTQPTVDCRKVWEEYRTSITLVQHTPGTHPMSNFAHLVGGYDARYYGYLYSKVFSADIFQRFLKEGILNEKVGLEYREKILGRGGSRDSMENLIDFLGREPTQEAFLRSIGALERLPGTSLV